jgi:hypothetical protein
MHREIRQDAEIVPPAGLEEVLQLSRRMLQAAQAGDWPALLEQERERRTTLDEIFTHSVSPQETPAMAAAIQELLHLDRQIARLGNEARRQVAGELKKLRQGRQVHIAYQVSG